MTVRLKQEKKHPVDQRAIDAKAMEGLLLTDEFKRFLEILSQMRNEATYMVMAVDTESIRNRERLRTLDEVISLPYDLIKKYKQAQEDT